jgi:outer membrane protein OmpA-like peptidoglycan-associated protein
MNPPNKSGWRGQRGGTGTRILVIFFLIGVVVLFLLARGCYQAVNSFRKSLSSSHNSSPAPAKPMAKNLPCPALDPSLSATLLKGQAASIIPVKPALVIDHIWSIQGHDLEELLTIHNMDERAISGSTSGPAVHFKNGKVDQIDQAVTFAPRDICQSDFNDSQVLESEGKRQYPRIMMGTTEYTVSRATFALLKNKKRAKFDYRQSYRFVGDGYSWSQDDSGSFEGRGDTKFHTIVNGVETDLPAISAQGSVNNNQVSMLILDDPANPLLLDYYNPAKEFRIKIVKVNFPVEKKLETDLAEKGRAEIYGIYFDFDSDQIRTESEPVLADIADVLKKQPEWKLNVEGHTDNVGGDKHNLDLSQRRAASVINALATRYQISAERLSPAGYGASRPKATNDTVEGRALNRRVELVRR